MRQGIRCFATPCRETAENHPSGYYGWMQQGDHLYRELESTHPLLAGLPVSGPTCFETFPHAITWHLRGGNARAARKRSQRRALLEQAGIDLGSLTSIDLVDAALCALAAHHVALGRPCLGFGEAATGLIVVPAGPLREGTKTPHRTGFPAGGLLPGAQAR